MARTTVNIDDSILQELKRLQRKVDKPLGEMISELVSEALAHRRNRSKGPPSFAWTARPMGAKIDLRDKDELWKRLDESARENI